MRKSRLPEAGENLFQKIKKVSAEAEAKGKKLIKLSIGQPSGPAIGAARMAASRAVMSEAESMHGYQDNGSPGVPDFARRFVQKHVRLDLKGVSADDIAFLPIPGIKPMLPLIPIACGAGRFEDYVRVATTTNPGYPTPADWCGYLNELVGHHAIRLHPGNKFRFSPEDIDYKVGDIGIADFKANLVMMNYPHNPSGQVATFDWLVGLCRYCSDHGIRIFNDAAYAILAYNPNHKTLTDIAMGFPELSWAEAFSASKAGNFTGWRIGAIAGSPDFVGDIARIKGNTDSGFAAPLAAGIIDLFENNPEAIKRVSDVYRLRLGMLIPLLSSFGMRLACTPGAGFFTLWLTPKRAFGQDVKNAEHFNTLMIENAGVVGVHFDPKDGEGDSYIRYSVAQVEVIESADELEAAFTSANVSY